jgi:transcriptional regulator with XRE-family HTH domain
MINNLFVFTTGIANLLADIRKKTRLSHGEGAVLIGVSPKLGHSYISRLEQGKIKNPFLRIIILYLDACNTSYNTFFSKLSELRFRQVHQEIMGKVNLSINAKTRKKVCRDTALHANKIKYQTKAPVLDYDKLKSRIDRKLTQYLSDHKVDKSLIPIYQDFTSYVLNRVLNPKPNPPLDVIKLVSDQCY